MKSVVGEQLQLVATFSGARSLAAMSLGIDYYGVDPLTSVGINKMMKF